MTPHPSRRPGWRRAGALSAAVVALASLALVSAACGGGTDGDPGGGATAPSGTGGGTTGGSGTAAPDGDPTAVRLVEEALDLEAPIDLVAVPGTDAVLVAERAGRVRLAGTAGGRLELRDEPVLDITERVSPPEGEQGLLGLAVSPDGTELYVDYTEARRGDTRVDAYALTGSGQGLRADPGSRRQLLAVPQPYPNHNGGALAVGPDGMLYVGMGDGGAGGDPQGRAQDPRSLLGKLLRLDPQGRNDADGDGVPDDNPLVTPRTDGRQGVPYAGRPEIWSLGLRNPWRLTFDSRTGALWVADVGQDRWEEINVRFPEGATPAGFGDNFGWDLFEGTQRFSDPDPSPEVGTDGPFVEPVLTYPHEDGACSVTGGVVVRDPDLPALAGYYLHGDYCRPGVRALRPGGPAPDGERSELDLVDTDSGVISFGTGPAGEVYVMTSDGTVARLAPA